MSLEFEEAFDRLIGYEGGYVNDPQDPGGETNWGISKRAYPNVAIALLSRSDAAQIYRRDFWNACGQYLHGAVAFQVFDAAVNHGIGNAVRFLQRAVGVADDGHWGAISLAAYNKLELSDALMLFLAERGEFMVKLSTFERFGRGWMRRIFQNLRYAAKDN